MQVKRITPPLLSLDFYLDHFDKLMNKLKTESDLRILRTVLGKKFSQTIENTIEKEPYDALVLTDADLKIVWVSSGFTEMTGYSKNYALGKNPNFLQGTETSVNKKSKIRKHINRGEGFTTDIINYRRSGEAYLCQIKAMPVYDANHKVVQYLAVEKELKAA